jgi:ABC-type polar amino acid transport system ATPase subunit
MHLLGTNCAGQLHYDSPLQPVSPVFLMALASDGMTMIIVTHEMNFARRVADRVVFMDHGAILEVAPPADFFTQARDERTRLFLSRILSH